MKKKNSLNKVEAVLQHVYFDSKLARAARIIRKKLGILEEGFVTSDESRRWFAERGHDYYNFYIQTFFDEFVPLGKKAVPAWGIMGAEEWHHVLSEILLLGNLSRSTMADLRNSGFDAAMIVGGKTYTADFKNKKMGDGVYLRLHTFASPHEIRKFVDASGTTIFNLQTSFRKVYRTTPHRRLKIRGNFWRDERIFSYMRKSRKELVAEYGINRKRKEDVVAQLLIQDGFEAISGSAIKKAYERFSRAYRRRQSTEL